MRINERIKELKYFIILLLNFFPSLSFAQGLEKLKTLLREFDQIVNITVPVVFGLVFVYFIWGAATFILNAGDSKLREEGKQRLIWGIIGMFVVISIFGIVQFINGALGVPLICANGGQAPGC